jgi:hypothetical protein
MRFPTAFQNPKDRIAWHKPKAAQPKENLARTARSRRRAARQAIALGLSAPETAACASLDALQMQGRLDEAGQMFVCGELREAAPPDFVDAPARTLTQADPGIADPAISAPRAAQTRLGPCRG